MARCAALVASIAVFIFSCRDEDSFGLSDYDEGYRPQYHFSPERNWMNDPNGLVYFKGEYHLFYQYNADGDRPGWASWGHAVSRDLLHWRELPVAIEAYLASPGAKVVSIFSGSAVVDEKNTSGLFPNGTGGMVAVYTAHHQVGSDRLQNQNIAFSADSGRRFSRYNGNPVLDLGHEDFRDPKVFWHNPQKKWVMAVAMPNDQKVLLYESHNLTSWKFLNEFGQLGDRANVWECPDLIEVPIEGSSSRKWVMLVSNGRPKDEKWLSVQYYFVGDFDGTRFTADESSQRPIQIDYGRDFYAGVTFNNVPNDRKVLMGWANNWIYGEDIPTWPWRGAMSLPRDLSLYQTENGLRLRQRPIAEFSALMGGTFSSNGTAGNESSFLLRIDIDDSDYFPSGVRLISKEDEETVIGYDPVAKEVFIDRTNSGDTGFNEYFPGIDRAPARAINGKVHLDIYVDRSIIEIYINDGEAVITNQVFPTEKNFTVMPYGDSRRVSFTEHRLMSVWK